MMHELQPGDPQLIGPYRLRGRLGAGGMGRVYLGLSPGGRAVAVKVIRADLAQDPEFRARFRREIAVARKVSSLYTAPVIAPPAAPASSASSSPAYVPRTTPPPAAPASMPPASTAPPATTAPPTNAAPSPSASSPSPSASSPPPSPAPTPSASSPSAGGY